MNASELPPTDTAGNLLTRVRGAAGGVYTLTDEYGDLVAVRFDNPAGTGVVDLDQAPSARRGWSVVAVATARTGGWSVMTGDVSSPERMTLVQDVSHAAATAALAGWLRTRYPVGAPV